MRLATIRRNFILSFVGEASRAAREDLVVQLELEALYMEIQSEFPGSMISKVSGTAVRSSHSSSGGEIILTVTTVITLIKVSVTVNIFRKFWKF